MKFKYPRIAAWSVHFLTALGAVFAVFAILLAIRSSNYLTIGSKDNAIFSLQLSIYCIFMTVFIDAIDGSLARLCNVKKYAQLDGGLLDNIIDFISYVIVPCVWLFIIPDVLPPAWVLPCIFMISISSCYQFCQTSAKTDDHFFLGFPSYWNLIVIFMLGFGSPAWFNVIVFIVLTIFVFIPIKYIYLSRLTNISKNKGVKIFITVYYIVASAFTIASIVYLPHQIPFACKIFVLSFIVYYILFSFYLNVKPVINTFSEK